MVRGRLLEVGARAGRAALVDAACAILAACGSAGPAARAPEPLLHPAPVAALPPASPFARVERDLRAFRSLRAYVRGPVVVLRSWEAVPRVVCGAAQAPLVVELEQRLASPDASLATCAPAGPARISCHAVVHLVGGYVVGVGVVFDADGERLVGATLFDSQRSFDPDFPAIAVYRATLENPSCP